MAERSTSKEHSEPEKPRTIYDRLRRLRWMFVRPDREPTPQERDLSTVLGALASGDELLVRRLAEVVDAQQQALDRADDLGVREHWFKELASWDGADPSPEDVAGRFANAMATFLERYSDAPHPDYVTTPARVTAVQRAFEITMASRFYERNPGRSLMSAGLAAMGVPRGEIDDALDKFRKTPKA